MNECKGSRGDNRMKKQLVVTLFAWIVGFSSSSHAQSTTNIWTGGNGAWSNDVQWSLSTAPSATDLILITNTASSYVVTIDSATPSTELTNYNVTIGFDN